ncbi:VWA domain-containing protein [Methanolobus profundi]|uniref:Ig-like domain (Group 1) n=1 Tax=Methanolobus profundi TaxID=487685 RepID=A0A1I4SS28_9EURY|nr:VWA domain-containing protein [Methanolobus profundi]SFM67179.1 Ig-like domain (group 1) [Methanolobus profundi]
MGYLKKLFYAVLVLIFIADPSLAYNLDHQETDILCNAGRSATISVLLSNNGTPVNNTMVNFTTDLGSLSSSSALTNSSGFAEVILDSTVAGVAHINASYGSVYNLTNVTFLPTEVSSIIIDVDPLSNMAGEVTNITFSPVDVFGNINSSVTVDLDIVITDLLGNTLPDIDLSVAPYNVTALDVNRTNSVQTYAVNPSGSAILNFNSTIAGNISINSTVGTVSNLTYLDISSRSPGLMRVVYNDDYTVNTSSSIYVTVLDRYENPVEGVNVTFTVSSPENTNYNSPIDYNSAFIYIDEGTTDSTGKVSNVFTTDKKAGDNTVGISAVNTSLDLNVTITGLADVIDNLFMSYSPEHVIADNQGSYVLSARPVDQFSNPILPLTSPIKEQVRFTTDSGAIVLVPLNTQGQANTLVGPTPYIESLSVTATYRNETGYTNFSNSTTLDFIAGSLDMMDLYSVPNAVLAQGLNGNHESEVTLVALDEWGHSLADINVTFNNTNTTVGTFTVDGINASDIFNATTDLEGRIYGKFTGNISGNTSIIATSGNITLSTNISVKSEPFMSVYLGVSPSSVSSGSLVNVTTVISVEGELPITRPAASAMLVLDRSGSMDPDYYAGTPLDVVLVLDRSGSMSGTALSDAKEAAKGFADNLVSNSEVGVVSFSTTSSVDLGMTLMNAYANRTPVHNAIDSLVAGGYTAMGEGMGDANDMLINDGRSDTTKVMVVLTDGETNTGDDQDGEEAIEFANDNKITIYTIGLGSSLDEALLRHIASETGGAYYNAPDSSDLDEIYNSIAQEISDYDISEVEYGTEGFTPYDHRFQDSLALPDSYGATFLINETLNDLKVQLDWSDSSDELHLQLTSPSGVIYGLYDDTTGYYPNGDTSEFIWIEPLSYLYPDNDDDTVETGNWTVNVTGTGSGTEPFTISTYIDKKSAAKISSHSFISSFDESRGDTAGLALYSFEGIVSSDNQTSYVLDNSSWVGYFIPDMTGFYTFNVTWDDTSFMDVHLYEGIDVVSSSNGTGSCDVSYMLSAGDPYYLEVLKGSGNGSDTKFTVNVSTSDIDTIMTAYYDSSGGGGTPRYRTWDGIEWSSEGSANYVGGSPYYVLLESDPLSSEVIMATSDNNYDLNVQIWDGSSWGSVDQFTSHLDSYSRRGFDLKYEQTSGDAVVVYVDTDIDGRIPMYRIWDGSSWSSGSAVDGSSPGAGDVGWVRLETDPSSDEMVLVTLDDQRDIRAQVWDGSSWADPVIITNNARATGYQCFDLAYEHGTGRAIVTWSDLSTGYVMYRIWDGSSWSSANNLYEPDERVYWIKMGSDPNSDNILLAALDNKYDIHVTSWNGSSWSSPLEIETDVYEYSRRSMDVAFEQSSGTGMVVWGTSDLIPRYRIWNGSSWGPESLASGLGGSGYTRWVQLTPDPDSDAMFLMTSDGNNDLNVQRWDGSSWSIVSEVETSSTRYYECFDIVFNDVDPVSESTPVSWNQWTASVTSTLENDSLSHLENAIDTITADGLTAIDEGLFVANTELSSADGNSTIVIMTDGMDNAGYHSLLEEAYRARDNNTVIYTVGFGNNESEVDPVLEEIANITGGEYYFAPNSSVLKDIFRGIASQITNFSAGGPVLDIHVPYNYVTSSSVAKASYIAGSSNATTGNATVFNNPVAPATGNAEPSINISSSMSTLEWQLPNMGAGDKWGIWYQMRIDGAGYVPIIMPTSTVTYTDLSGENITVYIPSGGTASVGGGAASVLSYSLGSLDMVPDKTTLPIASTSNIQLTLTDTMGNSSFAYVHLYSSIGYFDNYENPINLTVVGSDSVDFSSLTAGKAYITAYAYNVNNASDVLVAEEVIYVRPKGTICIC